MTKLLFGLTWLFFHLFLHILIFSDSTYSLAEVFLQEQKKDGGHGGEES